MTHSVVGSGLAPALFPRFALLCIRAAAGFAPTGMPRMSRGYPIGSDGCFVPFLVLFDPLRGPGSVWCPIYPGVSAANPRFPNPPHLRPPRGVEWHIAS